MTDTATYIKRLLMPNGKKQRARRVWSIDLETVWIPFLTATNTTQDTAISPDALGCPLRLAYAKDGSVRFNQNGKPTIRVNKDLSNTIRIIRENFTATLVQHTEVVMADMPDEYARQVELNNKAGEPIAKADAEALDKANAERLEAELKALTEPHPEPEPARRQRKREPEPATV